MNILNLKVLGTPIYFKYKDTSLVLTYPDYYKMSDVYPDTYQTMKSIPNKLNTNDLTYDISDMFNDCYSLESISDLDTSEPINLQRCFYKCNNLKSINTLDMKYTTTAYMTFAECFNLEEVNLINTSNIKDAAGMFYRCFNLKEINSTPLDKATNINHMFNMCVNLEKFPEMPAKIEGNASYAFFGCEKMTVDTVPYLDTSKVTDMHHMFTNCASLEGEFPYAIDLSSIDSYEKLTNMFSRTQYESLGTGHRDTELIDELNCHGDYSLYSKKMNNLTTIRFKNVNETLRSHITPTLLTGYYATDPHCQNMTIIFEGDSVILDENGKRKLDLTKYFDNKYDRVWDTLTEIPQEDIEYLTNIHPTSLMYTFGGLVLVEEIPQSMVDTWDMSDITKLEQTFCHGNKSGIYPNLDTSNVTDMSTTFSSAYIKKFPNFDMSKVTNINNMFEQGDIADDMDWTYFNTSNVRTMEYTFRSNTLKTAPEMDTRNVTSFYGTFGWCKNLKNVPDYDISSIPNYNINNPGALNGMFQCCSSLNKAPQLINSRNTTGLIDASNLFRYCYSLDEVPEMNTELFMYMKEMFAQCYHLPKIFPWTIDVGMAPWPEYLKDMFLYSNVREVTLHKVSDRVKEYIRNSGRQDLLDSRIVVKFDDEEFLTVDDNHKDFSNKYPKDTTTIFNVAIDTKKLTDASSLFEGYTALQHIPFINIYNVTNVNKMFKNCINLEEVLKLETDKVTDASSMFENCKKITEIPFLELRNCINYNSMFKGCESLTGELHLIIDCRNITNTNQLKDIVNGTNITTIKLFKVNDSIKDNITSELLKGDNSLTVEFVKYRKLNSDVVTTGDTYDKIKSPYEITTLPEDYIYEMEYVYGGNSFDDCCNLETLSGLEETWTANDGRAISFFNCKKLKSLNLSKMGPLYNCTNINSMFCYCEELEDIGLSLLGPEVTQEYGGYTVQYCRGTFKDCKKLRNVPYIDMRLTAYCQEMFMNCESLPEEFPWTINLQGQFKGFKNADGSYKYEYITANEMEDMFTGSSVTKVKIHAYNEVTKNSIMNNTHKLKKDGPLEIEFI